MILKYKFSSYLNIQIKYIRYINVTDNPMRSAKKQKKLMFLKFMKDETILKNKIIKKT